MVRPARGGCCGGRGAGIRTQDHLTPICELTMPRWCSAKRVFPDPVPNTPAATAQIDEHGEFLLDKRRETGSPFSGSRMGACYCWGIAIEGEIVLGSRATSRTVTSENKPEGTRLRRSTRHLHQAHPTACIRGSSALSIA